MLLNQPPLVSNRPLFGCGILTVVTLIFFSLGMVIYNQLKKKKKNNLSAVGNNVLLPSQCLSPPRCKNKYWGSPAMNQYPIPSGGGEGQRRNNYPQWFHATETEISSGLVSPLVHMQTFFQSIWCTGTQILQILTCTELTRDQWNPCHNLTCQ